MRFYDVKMTNRRTFHLCTVLLLLRTLSLARGECDDRPMVKPRFEITTMSTCKEMGSYDHIITDCEMRKLFPKACSSGQCQSLLPTLNDALRHFDLACPKRIAAFTATVSVLTNELTMHLGDSFHLSVDTLRAACRDEKHIRQEIGVFFDVEKILAPHQCDAYFGWRLMFAPYCDCVDEDNLLIVSNRPQLFWYIGAWYFVTQNVKGKLCADLDLRLMADQQNTEEVARCFVRGGEEGQDYATQAVYKQQYEVVKLYGPTEITSIPHRYIKKNKSTVDDLDDVHKQKQNEYKFKKHKRAKNRTLVAHDANKEDISTGKKHHSRAFLVVVCVVAVVAFVMRRRMQQQALNEQSNTSNAQLNVFDRFMLFKDVFQQKREHHAHQQREQRQQAQQQQKQNVVSV